MYPKSHERNCYKQSLKRATPVSMYCCAVFYMVVISGVHYENHLVVEHKHKPTFKIDKYWQQVCNEF